MSAALKGRRRSAETRAKISAGKKGKPASGAAHYFGVEVEPGLWLSRKTGKLLLDQRQPSGAKTVM